MPLPRDLGRFNKVVTNRVLGPLANVVRPFATVIHRGRRSGRTHRTTVWAFQREGTIAIALTYGPDADWVQNLVAAGEGEMVLGGHRYRLVNPRIVGDEEGRRLMPPPVRAGLAAIDVHHYLVADVA